MREPGTRFLRREVGREIANEAKGTARFLAMGS